MSVTLTVLVAQRCFAFRSGVNQNWFLPHHAGAPRESWESADSASHNALPFSNKHKHSCGFWVSSHYLWSLFEARTLLRIRQETCVTSEMVAYIVQCFGWWLVLCAYRLVGGEWCNSWDYRHKHLHLRHLWLPAHLEHPLFPRRPLCHVTAMFFVCLPSRLPCPAVS